MKKVIMTAALAFSAVLLPVTAHGAPSGDTNGGGGGGDTGGNGSVPSSRSICRTR